MKNIYKYSGNCTDIGSKSLHATHTATQKSPHIYVYLLRVNSLGERGTEMDKTQSKPENTQQKQKERTTLLFHCIPHQTFHVKYCLCAW